MLRGNLISCIIYNIIVLMVFIATGEPSLLLLLIVNVFLLGVQNKKSNKEKEEQQIAAQKRINSVISRETIYNEYKNRYPNKNENELREIVENEYIRRKAR